jgi:hypothetical protein
MGVVGQRHTPAAFTLGKETRYPLYTRLGGHQGGSGGLNNNNNKNNNNIVKGTHREVTANRPDIIIQNKKKVKACILIDLAIPATEMSRKRKQKRN